MRHLACILGLLLAVVSGHGKHDLSCFKITNPSGEYVQADSAIPPILSITNLGDETESGFFAVFFAVDETTGDTTFIDSTEVSDISPGDSIEVEIPAWTPEGHCDEEEPFVYYELIGVTNLDTDEDHTNDSAQHNVICLLNHDVGVTDIVFAEDPSSGPNFWKGDTVTATATVENFGYQSEDNFDVRLEIVDLDSNVLLWQNVQTVEFLDWRGNGDGNPYTIDITFPSYVLINNHHQTLEIRTELIGDECSDDDEKLVRLQPIGIRECDERATGFMLNVVVSDMIRFAIPRSTWIKLDIFDASGRWVRNVVNDPYEPGTHYVTWDGCDNAGKKVASGIYLVRMQAQNPLREMEYQTVRKIIILE